MNPEEKSQNQGDAVDTHRRPEADASADAALELGEIKLIKPLRVADEDLGSDPYNRTGRFWIKD